MVSVAGCGSRQDEEALAASALLDLATASSTPPPPSDIIDNKTSVITSNPSVSSSNANSQRNKEFKIRPQPHPKETTTATTKVPAALVTLDQKDGLVHLMVTSNSQGQKVLQLPNGMEFLFDPRPAMMAASSISLSTNLLNDTLLPAGMTSSAGSNNGRESGQQRPNAVIDLSTKKVKTEVHDGNNNIRIDDQEMPFPSNQQQVPPAATVASCIRSPQQIHQQRDATHAAAVATTHLLAPNVLHFLPQGNQMRTDGGIYGDADNIIGRRSFSSGSSSCSSVDDGSDSCCSSSGGGAICNPAATGILISSNSSHTSSGTKKRGRKRLYDHCSDQMMMHHPHYHHQQEHQQHHHAPSNPIKEFRQRQRVRERQEDDRLTQLENRYKSTAQPLTSVQLDDLYDSHGLNMKFPRVKTTTKRGKAADDSERTNRKKECARRDSKNYRERAKAKRDLIVKKISFLEDLLKSISCPKYQYVF